MAVTYFGTSWTPVPVAPAKRKPDGPPAAVPMPPLSELDFAGCEAFPLTRGEYSRHEGRLEVWDAETETAWRVRSPTTMAHESPGQRLAGLVERIAAVRGSPIHCYGSADLLVRDAQGKRRRVMQADQVVYLYPSRADLMGAAAMVVAASTINGTTRVVLGCPIKYIKHLLSVVYAVLPGIRAGPPKSV